MWSHGRGSSRSPADVRLCLPRQPWKRDTYLYSADRHGAPPTCTGNAVRTNQELQAQEDKEHDAAAENERLKNCFFRWEEWGVNFEPIP